MFFKRLKWRNYFSPTGAKRRAVLLFIAFSNSILAQDVSTIHQQAPVSLNGNLGANSTYYSASGIDNRQTPFTWMINGNLNARIYGIDIPITLLLTEQQRRFTQPFNQFGLSPKYKWALAHVGYRSMVFSPYTLSGMTFFGLGMELNPGKVRFAAMKGRFQKAINEDTLSTSAITPTFKRTGYAVKLGYGTSATYIDLIYLKAGDQKESLNYIPLKSEVLPQDNTVVGLSGKATLKKVIKIDADVAISEYRRNLLVAEDKISRIALSAGASYQFTNANLRLQFKRIDPDYKSLGAAYINADIQEITFIPTINLLKKKMRLQASIGTQHDNLKNDKSIATNRLIFSLNGSYQPIQSYGIDVIYSNYGISQSKGTQELNDTIRISQTLSNFTVNNRYTKVKTSAVQTFVLTTIFQSTNDQNQFTESFSESKSKIGNLTYVRTPINRGWMYTGSMMYTQVDVSSTALLSYGLTLGTGKDFLNRTLLINTNASLFLNEVNNKKDGKTISWNLSGNYKPHKKHQFTLSANWLNRKAESNTIKEFNELRLMTGYVYSF
ncbi:MAG: hypothetical protein ACKVQV_07350 [Bacteroidia bacterium]